MHESMKSFTSSERGFTLIEILTTIVLIGIISLSIFTMYNFYFVTAFESIESSNKQSTIMDMDATIKTELLVYDAEIDVDEEGHELIIGDSVFHYDNSNRSMNVTWEEEDNTYYNLYPLETEEEEELPIFEVNDERIIFNIKLEDRHDTIEFSNQYIIRDGRYDKEYILDEDEEE